VRCLKLAVLLEVALALKEMEAVFHQHSGIVAAHRLEHHALVTGTDAKKEPLCIEGGKEFLGRL